MKNSSLFKSSFAVMLVLTLLLLLTPVTMAEDRSNHFAVEVISSDNLGDGVLGDADAVIGKPATWCESPAIGGFPGGPFRVKLVEAAYNTDLEGNPVLAQIQDGGHITVKFAGKVHNNPANPYGIDFIIYSNTFFTGVGYVDDNTDMNDYIITGGGFNDAEQGIVSVSQDGETWYAFDDGPSSKADLFPTQAFQWDAEQAKWTDEKMDFTKAVNPALTVDDFIGESAADAIALYDGAGGGTGFDLDDVDLEWIQYVKVEATGNKTEVDAFAAVSFLDEDPEEVISIDLRATGRAGDIFNKKDLEIPGGEVTVNGFTLDRHTAMGALAYYCLENGINIEITAGDWGRYVYQIGDDPGDQDSWMYYVDQSSPWVGADQYELSEEEAVHFVNFNLNLYSLSMSLEPETIEPGEIVTATVLYKDGDGKAVPAEDAEIYYTDELDDWGSPVAGTRLEDVNTDHQGKASFNWEDEGTYYFYAQWQDKSSQFQWPVATLVCVEPPFPDVTSKIYWQHADGSLKAWHMDGSEQISTSPLTPASIDPAWLAKAVVDSDGDAHSDIYFYNQSAGLVKVWLMEGLEKVGTVEINNPAAHRDDIDPVWDMMAVYDLNGSGEPDIIWQRDDGVLAVWLMQDQEAVATGRLYNRYPDEPYVSPDWRIGAILDLLGDDEAEVIWHAVGGEHEDQLAYWKLELEDEDAFKRSASARLINRPPDDPGIIPIWSLRASVDLFNDGKQELLFQRNDGELAYWTLDGLRRDDSGRLEPRSIDLEWTLVGAGN